jgi:hypothetical protein
VKGSAEEVGWASIQAEVACPDYLMAEKPARSVFAEGDRIIHHLQELYHPFERRGAGLLRRFSSQPTHQLNDIHGGSNGHMAQMGFAQTDIARSA